MNKQDRDAPAYPIGSVDKALRLLLLVAERKQGIRLGEASSALGVAPSTAHRLLQMLGHYGFAEQDPESKTYRAGPAIRRMRNSRTRVLELARPILQDLVELTNETVHLADHGEGLATTILSVVSTRLLCVGDRAGHSQPAYLSSMGKVLLAGLGENELRELFPSIRDRTGPETAEEMLAVLEEVRQRGFWLHDGEVEPGVSALAVPVHDSTGGVEFAIGIAFPTGRIAESEIPGVIEAARTAAASLSAALRD